MGGYGALRLGGLLGADRVGAVVAVEPGDLAGPDEASRPGFDDAEEYETFTCVGHQDDLDGIAVRVDCGTGDPFYRDVQDYVAAFPARCRTGRAPSSRAPTTDGVLAPRCCPTSWPSSGAA